MNLMFYIFFGLLLFSFHGTPLCSGANDILAVEQALAVGDKLVSRNGKFALGFFQPIIVSKSGNITSPNWYLGISFSNISDFTTVWVANRDRPITDLQLNLAQLKLSEDGKLVISSNASLIWSIDIFNSTTMNSTASVVLLNDGNLVIGSSSNVLWQSFDNPTDVFLPGAKFGWNKVSGFTRQFTSKKNLIDPGFGMYYAEFGNKGIVLNRHNYSET